MGKYWGNDVLAYLSKPIYVSRMRQHKMSKTQKHKWLKELRIACEYTIEHIDSILRSEQ